MTTALRSVTASPSSRSHVCPVLSAHCGPSLIAGRPSAVPRRRCLPHPGDNIYAALRCGMTPGRSPAAGNMKVLTKASRVQAAI
jgi:hypothetical protein